MSAAAVLVALGLVLSGCKTVQVNPPEHDTQWLREHGLIKDIPEGASKHEHQYLTIGDDNE